MSILKIRSAEGGINEQNAIESRFTWNISTSIRVVAVSDEKKNVRLKALPKAERALNVWIQNTNEKQRFMKKCSASTNMSEM